MTYSDLQCAVFFLKQYKFELGTRAEVFQFVTRKTEIVTNVISELTLLAKVSQLAFTWSFVSCISTRVFQVLIL